MEQIAIELSHQQTLCWPLCCLTYPFLASSYPASAEEIEDQTG